MARVEAEAELRGPAEAVHDRDELVERAADRPAGAGGVLEKEPGRVGARRERALERRHRPGETGVEPGAEMRADVENDAVGLDRGGDADRVQERLHGALRRAGRRARRG